MALIRKYEFVRNPLVVALDVDDESKALQLVEELGDVVGCFKVGPRLVVRSGLKLIERISKVAPVFLDHKFFDIPSTMVGAIRAAFDAGVTLATIHTLAGSEAIQELVKLEQELNQQRPFRLLGVTLLTSWTEASYPPIFKEQNISDSVASLAQFGKTNGMRGFVCSGHELESLRNLGIDKANGDFILVPGVRRSQDSKQDQSRIMKPLEAMKAGATAIVVGRPIIEDPNPRQVAMDFAMEVFGT